MHSISIIKATISDLESLTNLASVTFYEAFAAANTKSDMDIYMGASFTPEKIAEELNHPESEFYFASIDDIHIGYLKVNFGLAQSELKQTSGMEIERIYVLQSYQNMKVGQLLFEYAMEIAKSVKLNYVWLGVWEKNPRAISFYERNGFMAFGKHDFMLGMDLQTDIMMKKSLGES
jgi:ribosomal protein S18 acetylase RimI-like enzyme